MRLINVYTLELEEYMPDAIPPFAILSHTWEADEVSYAEMMNSDSHLLAKKKGYQKIVRFCELVRRPIPDVPAQVGPVDYAWVDTCCIDKTSSAELSEAINSMSSWYAMSRFCLAYLSDYTYEYAGSGMGNSRWYTRGWTLQELLAPRTVVFADREWHFFGSRASLRIEVAKASGIDPRALETRDSDGFLTTFEPNIATRMSWAAKRETSRPEDMAYCLLGLFQVNMPLLYGEGGERAFVRLQEEIIKESDDQSIFIWNPDENRRALGSLSFVLLGILAAHPSEFADSSGCESLTGTSEEPHTVTSRGIKIHLSVMFVEHDQRSNGTLGIPQCLDTSLSFPRRYGIPLLVVPSPGNALVYGRDCRPLVFLDAMSVELDGQAKMQDLCLLKRTKMLNEHEIPFEEIRIRMLSVFGKVPDLAACPKMVFHIEEGSKSYTSCDSPSSGRRWMGDVVQGKVPLANDGKATVFVQGLRWGRHPISESFMIGVEREPGKRQVTVALKRLKPRSMVKVEDMPQLHNELHSLVKAQVAYLEIPRKGGLSWLFMEPSRRALIEAATFQEHGRCTVGISVSFL